jgi:hypothetical protein
MNDAAKLPTPFDGEDLRACYEGISALVNLTVHVQDRSSRWREFLRSGTLAVIGPTPLPASRLWA